MRRHTLTAVTAAATLALALTGCGSESDPDDDAKSTPSASSPASADSADTDTEQEDGDHKDDVEITKHGVEDHETWGPDAYVVHYKITNSGDKAASYYAGIEFVDSDGDVLGSTGITADKLGAGKSKQDHIAPLPVEIENGEPSDIDDVRVTEVDRTDPI